MKDGRTHLAHKAEHAVDLETGALVAVTVQPAASGDTHTIYETLATCTEQIREVAATLDGQDSATLNPEGPAEVVLDKGYHSNDVLLALAQVDMRAYCSEPDRGRRNWIGKADEKAAVYANRRRIRGERGKRLLRQRGERVERSFAHMYETGRMRRTHLRHHANILKRLLIHASAFNLGLLMRKICGSGTPRRLRDRLNALINALMFLYSALAGFMSRRRNVITPAMRFCDVQAFSFCHSAATARK